MNTKTLSEQAGKKDHYEGDFVLQTQQTGEGFKHVSKNWLDKTLTFEQVIKQGQEYQKNFKDVEGLWLSDLEALDGLIRNDGKDGEPGFGVLHTSRHSLRQFCTYLGLPTDYIEFLASADTNLHDLNVNCAIRRAVKADQEWKVQCDAAEKAKTSRPPRPDHADREVFLRLNLADGVARLRALLTNRYAVINNLPVIETLGDIIPKGRVSHLHYDGDTIRANILIPDSLRTERDSDYGGGISVLNNETGRTQFSTRPFVFRAICQNGNIWDRQNGLEFNRRHLGTINWADFRKAVVLNINKQIPLVQENITKVLSLKGIPVTEQEIQQAIVFLGRKERLTQEQARSWFSGFQTELKAAPVKDDLSSAFGIVQGLTRAAQEHEFDVREYMETLSGRLIDSKWDRILTAARNDVSVEQAQEVLSPTV